MKTIIARYLPFCSLALALAACSPQAAPPGAAQPPRPSQVEGQAPQAQPKGMDSGEKAPRPLSVAYTSTNGAMASLWLIKEGGLDRRNGLDLDISYVASSTQVIPAMLTGELAFATVSGGSVVTADMGGADLVVIGTLLDKILQSFLVRPEIRGPQDLKGKAVGITRFGSLTDFSARIALNRWGLDPEKDVTLIQTFGLPETLAALETGAISGGLISPPVAFRGKRMGLRELMDMSAIDLEYLSNGLVSTRSFLKANPEVARAFIKAYVEAIHLFKTNKQLAVDSFRKYLKEEDPDILEDSYALFREILKPAPYPSLRGMQTAIEELAETRPEARGLNPNDYVDLSYIKELEDSGHIRRLYGQ